MKIVKATKKYEEWLGKRMPLIQVDLDYKHERMATDLYEFMRATFYRWIQLWPEECADLDSAPSVLAVGDLHTDNFGSWRDIEGRLVWGINDFDEAFHLPYTFDLVRLVTSAYIAITEDQKFIEMQSISEAVLAGYKDELRSGGDPFVLAEDHRWLRDLMLENLKEPAKFWQNLDELPILPEALPTEAKAAIDMSLPRSGIRYRISHRTAGLGSLGRRRFLALMKLDRFLAARETKELTVSTCVWALDTNDSTNILYSKIVEGAVRSPDPFLNIYDRWLVRRLSPDYSRLDFSMLTESDVIRLLSAMGAETANIHLGSRDAIKDIRKDIKQREEGWLTTAAEAMLDKLSEDFGDWQDYWYQGAEEEEKE